jgi:hypothetical protein
MKRVKAALVAMALAAQWAIAGGPLPASATMQSARAESERSTPRPAAAIGSPSNVGPVRTRLVALNR